MASERIKAEDLQIGEYLSEVQYYKIIEIANNSVQVTNERGFKFDIDKDIIAEGMYSASQYKAEKLVSRTEICEQLEKAGNHIFTVNFHKQVKAKDIENKLLKAIKTDSDRSLSETEIIKIVKKVSKTLLAGEARTLIGYLSKTEPKIGRSTVIDLELSPDKYRIRQVDHRTINWLILKNVKYLVK